MEVEVYGDKFPIIEVRGEIDHYYAPALEDNIKQAIAVSPNKSIIVDIENVNYLDSAGIGVLFATIDEMKKKSPGKNLIMICTNPNVKKILELVGIETDPTFIVVAKKDLALEQAESGVNDG